MSKPLEDYLAFIPEIDIDKLQEILDADVLKKSEQLDKLVKKSLVHQKKIQKEINQFNQS